MHPNTSTSRFGPQRLGPFLLLLVLLAAFQCSAATAAPVPHHGPHQAHRHAASRCAYGQRRCKRRAHGSIVNGSLPLANWPWIVSLEDKRRLGGEVGQHFCGGTLIRPHVVMTA